MPHRASHRILVAIGLIAVLTAACQSSDEPTSSATSSTTPTSSGDATTPASASAPATDGEETSVFDLEVGDCFSEVGDAAESVVVTDCADSHLYEVFALLDHPGGDSEAYPGSEEIGDFGDTECREPFTAYVGHDYETSVYWITTLTPSEETWAEGDREIVCTLRLGEDAEPTTGSAEGAGE